MIKMMIGMVVGVLLGAGAVVGGSQAQADTVQPVWMTRPCVNEDSPNCYWDAQSAGNGEGHSFWSIRFPHRDCVVYWSPSYGKKHDRCFAR